MEEIESKQEGSETTFLSRSSENVPGGLNLHIGLIGANFKTAPIAVREVLARGITVEKLAHLKGNKLAKSGTELVLLSTCNRIEIYYACENLSDTTKILRQVFIEAHLQYGPVTNDFRTYTYSDSRAIEHLFEVSAGLDSLVVGEAQILSQVHEACRVANERGLCGPALSKLFSKAYSTGREIRESYPRFTNGFRNSISLSVSDLIASHFGTRKERPNIVLVGSGKMIKLAVSSFDKSRFGKVVIAARRQPLKDIEADQIVHLSDLPRTISEQDIDVIITATSSDNFVIRPSDIEPFSKQNPTKELLIIDISVPRNVDPQAAKIFPNVTLLNLDDLKERIANSNVESVHLAERNNDLAAIGASISVRRHEFISWMKESSEITPLMIALRRKAEMIRSEELNNALARLADLTPGQKDVILKMSERIIRRFLHDPTSNLKNMVRMNSEAKSKDYAYLLKELFSLDFPQSSQEETPSSIIDSPESTVF